METENFRQNITDITKIFFSIINVQYILEYGNILNNIKIMVYNH